MPPSAVASDPAAASPPILVEVTRGDVVESEHRGHFAVVDTEGRAVLAAGNVETEVFPRSAIKPLQTLPLVETGAADAFGLCDRDLALACASHNGEPDHVASVEAWLERIGCGARDLVCAGHPPIEAQARDAFHRRRETARRTHDNCSGKHAGFLTLARHLGAPVAGYHRLTHAAQQRVLGALETLTGLDDLARRPHGTDGCGIPALTMPIGNLALAMARLGRPDDQPAPRQNACRAVRGAMAAHPWLVAGSRRFDTDGMDRLAPRVLLKTGAEGVQTACLPELGLGIAVKIADGAARAAPVVIGALLDKLGVLSSEDRAALRSHFAPEVQDRAGTPVGAIRPSAAIV
jgi:L-asparaginase II